MDENNYQNRRPRSQSSQDDIARRRPRPTGERPSQSGSSQGTAPRRTAQTGRSTTQRSTQGVPRQQQTGRYSQNPERRRQEANAEYRQAYGNSTDNRRRQAVNSSDTRRRPQTQELSGDYARSGQRSQRSQNSQPVRRQGGNNYSNRPKKKKKSNKKRNIILFIVEIIILLILLAVFWLVMKSKSIEHVEIQEDEVEINEQILTSTETGAMKGYRNIALFGVDSRDKELDKNTRTDTIMIVSINMDTKEVKLVSLYRDTYLNLSTDTYNKANSAYAKGGPKQAISMLNMNLDMNITDYVTVGFDGLIDVIDAVGGIDIDVHEDEIQHLNSYQISMVGKEDGTLNAKGEPNYVATAGVDYTPVKNAGMQTLNGLQATAYCRIRYVGNDFGRTQRQRLVLTEVAKKAVTLNPVKLNNIAEAVFPKISTSLKLDEIVSLLGGIAEYKIGESAGFPFEGQYKTGNIGKRGSCVVPTDLEQNVITLHEFFFKDEEYSPSDTVKKCSQQISSDTSSYLK